MKINKQSLDLDLEEKLALRNRKLIGWKIYYGDGSEIDSKKSKWIDAPQKNVQVVKMFYSSDSGIEINTHHNQEYYLLDDLLEVPPQIKIAKAIDGKLFYEILEKANKDNEIITEMIDFE